MKNGSDHVFDPRMYIPGSLSEIYDLLAHLIGGAPKFFSPAGVGYPAMDIHSNFYQLTEGFARVRPKLGEERYAALMDLAARAKQLFLDDPEDSNGKTMEGIKLIWQIEEIIQAARRRRVKEKRPDDEGEITGD